MLRHTRQNRSGAETRKKTHKRRQIIFRYSGSSLNLCADKPRRRKNCPMSLSDFLRPHLTDRKRSSLALRILCCLKCRETPVLLYHRPSRLVSENPLVSNFSNTLLMFSVHQQLSTQYSVLAWTPAFVNALEDRLNLPTVKELHVA
jgi:hypothetical protein